MNSRIDEETQPRRGLIPASQASSLRAASLALLAVIGAVACGDGADGAPAAVKQKPVPLKSGEIETWAGTDTQGDNGDGKDRTETWLDQPMEMVFADDGSAIVVDWNNHCVRRV